MLGLPEWAYLLVAVVVGTLGTARAARLVVDDEYPPIVAFRNAWRRLVNDGRGPNWSTARSARPPT